MRQIRMVRRRPAMARWWLEPLPPGPRDPDIVRAHQITRQASRPRASQARPDLRPRDLPAAVTARPRPPGRIPEEHIMHPVIQQQLAAEHTKHMLAVAGQARRARRPRRPAQSAHWPPRPLAWRPRSAS